MRCCACALLVLLIGPTSCRDAAPLRAVPVVPDATLPPTVVPSNPSVDLKKTARKAEEALRYCAAHDLSTQYAILIDGSLHSGVRRFFLWSFARRRIEHAALVGHGCCDHQWSGTDSREHATFSNVIGSHCSSVGKYRHGARRRSDWGIHVKYELHGLEETNSNALSRFIVLHGWEAIPDEEVYPEGTPEGWGCPAISNASMRFIDSILQEAPKPLLLWIYDD
jgi:hypothetical protein